MQKNNEMKKEYQKDQQTFISFVKLYMKSLGDNLIKENEYKCSGKSFSFY